MPLGPGAKCCGDPDSCDVDCELGTAEPVVAAQLPSLADLDELNELDDEEEDDE